MIHILQWGCLAILILSIFAVAVGGVWLLTKAPTSPPGPRPTAVVWTATPTPTPTATATPLPSPSPTLPLAPDTIGVGVRVRVSGTGDAGLSIRAEASTHAERLYIATEDGRLLVAGGPVEADGFTWWFVRDEINPEREGWAVENYLSVENE